VPGVSRTLDPKSLDRRLLIPDGSRIREVGFSCQAGGTAHFCRILAAPFDICVVRGRPYIADGFPPVF
jgi:hypothetical protein